MARPGTCDEVMLRHAETDANHVGDEQVGMYKRAHAHTPRHFPCSHHPHRALLRTPPRRLIWDRPLRTSEGVQQPRPAQQEHTGGRAQRGAPAEGSVARALRLAAAHSAPPEGAACRDPTNAAPAPFGYSTESGGFLPLSNALLRPHRPSLIRAASCFQLPKTEAHPIQSMYTDTRMRCFRCLKR